MAGTPTINDPGFELPAIGPGNYFERPRRLGRVPVESGEWRRGKSGESGGNRCQFILPGGNRGEIGVNSFFRLGTSPRVVARSV